jgi:hypothetical protein
MECKPSSLGRTLYLSSNYTQTAAEVSSEVLNVTVTKYVGSMWRKTDIKDVLNRLVNSMGLGSNLPEDGLAWMTKGWQLVEDWERNRTICGTRTRAWMKDRTIGMI